MKGERNMLVISPGHWKMGSGASDLIDEVTEARKVVKQVSANWHASKIVHAVVQDNQSTNVSENVNYLIKQHSQHKNAQHFSVHFNSTSGTREQGIGCEILYAHDAMKPLAMKMVNAICNASGLKNRGSKLRTDLKWLNTFAKNGILIEVCFVNSKADVALYQKHFRKICHAIAEAAREKAVCY